MFGGLPNYPRTCFFVLGILLLCSCGMSAQQVRTEIDREVGTIRDLQADQTASLEEMHAQIRRMSGQIEELQHRVLGKTAELEKTLRRFSTRVPPPEGVPERTLNADEVNIRRNSGEAAALFSQGLQQIRAGDFRRALISFETFVSENPDTAFTDNALFWQGVALERQGNYGKAIQVYNRVYIEFPAEDRVADSLFRLGETFLQIGSGKEGRDTLQKVVDDFPRSEAAKEARDRIKELRRNRRTRR